MKDRSTLPGWPLMLRRELAAAYVGMCPRLFDDAVNDGLIPPPIPLVGTVKAWHRSDLEAWLEDRRAAATKDTTPNDWDQVLP